MSPLTAPARSTPADDCLPREVVVEQALPELLAAFNAREDLRRASAPVGVVSAAADRLGRARAAVRAGC